MSLSAKKKQTVTTEWQQLFPHFVSTTPMRLLKRNAVVLCGLQLDLTSQPDRYVPTAFMHNLAITFPVISMNCPASYRSERGADLAITSEQHPSLMTQAAAQLQQRLPWLTRTELSVNDVIQHASQFLAGKFGPAIPFQTGPMELAITAAACGAGAAHAALLLEQYLAEMAGWPARAFNIIGSIDAWREKMRALIQEPSQATAMAAAEVVKHKLTELRDYALAAGL